MAEASRQPHFGRVNTSTEHFGASAEVRRDGRVDIHLCDKTSKLTKLLDGLNVHSQGRSFLGEKLTKKNKKYNHQMGYLSGIPRINIAIHIVGSRGDVQPFIAIAQVLSKPPYSHRVRICTHPVFKDFVEENGLEFFSIGGDPATLMAYMVKNPGLMPGIESLKAGDVSKRRADIAEIINGCWRGCIEPGNGMGEDKNESPLTNEEMADSLFIADAIIANPPSYGHIHCAEKLGIPLHMMFTMPWSPTQYFPHPLASMDANNSDPNFANYISYTMMELLAWQGLGDIINNFRVQTLNLDPISPLWGHMLLSRMKVPFTYAWSSALIEKPLDWGPHIKISGFSFLNQASNYKPPSDLKQFLDSGPPPVYIGFGSIVVEHPEELTKMIFGAVKRAGVRALVSKGWGGIGGEEAPEGVFLLGNCPHDWLFNYVSCVVHHGGAGTTAIGIAMGKPTVIVPFFGDQPFWGAMIYRAGAGPEPIPFKKMTEESLAQSIITALGPDIQTAVKEMSQKIAGENGAEEAAASFHRSVNMDSMRCLICPNRVAVWRVKKTNIRLSSKAASVLLDHQVLDLSQMKLVKHRDWYVDEGAGGPIMGTIAVASGTTATAIGLITNYTRNLKMIHRKLPTSDNSSTASEDPAIAELAKLESLNQVPSRNPVRRAVKFSPQHLEGLAYRMVCKNFPKAGKVNKSRYGYGRKRKADGREISGTGEGLVKRLTGKGSRKGKERGKLHDVSVETGRLAEGMLITGLRAPVSLFYNLANGFHNAPSFFLHDNTVRRRSNITGLGSGLKVAGKEAALSFFDAFSGLIIHPYTGASQDGILGFAKGVGRGIGGLILKINAAAFAIPGYTLKGIEKQVEKRYSRGLKAEILSVRLKQGIRDLMMVDEEEQMMVLDRWREVSETEGWGGGSVGLESRMASRV